MVRTKISPFIKSLLPGGSSNPDRFRQTILATPSHNLALSLLPYGLTFNSLYITRPNGETEDLLIGPTKPEEHDWQHETGRKFRNQIVGRYANRLPSGKTVLANGEVIDLDVIEPPSVCLHGGSNGFDLRTWILIPRSDSQLFPPTDTSFPPLNFHPHESSLNAGSETVWRLHSDHKDSGFPGKLLVEVLVGVYDVASESEGNSKSRLRYAMRANLEDGETKGTPVNLTVHWGFNLGGKKGEKDDIKEHKLWLDSSRYVDLEPNLLPSGELNVVSGTPYDFRTGGPNEISKIRKIGDVWDEGNGVDHCLVFDQPFPTISDKKPQVILISPDDKIRLTFSSNQSSVQVYTAKYFDGKGSRKEFHTTGSPSDGYTQFQAVFLEFQQVIGACLPGKDKLVEASGGDDTILKPGEIYENWVETEVEVLP